LRCRSIAAPAVWALNGAPGQYSWSSTYARRATGPVRRHPAPVADRSPWVAACHPLAPRPAVGRCFEVHGEVRHLVLAAQPGRPVTGRQAHPNGGWRYLPTRRPATANERSVVPDGPRPSTPPAASASSPSGRASPWTSSSASPPAFVPTPASNFSPAGDNPDSGPPWYVGWGAGPTHTHGAPGSQFCSAAVSAPP